MSERNVAVLNSENLSDNLYLGIDTSNYTSSCAVYDGKNDAFDSRKKLLPVKNGQKGLRQSDAVFHHTANLPPLLSDLCEKYSRSIKCVSYSYAPRDALGSYMPCFSVGKGYAKVLASSFGASLYPFSHQAGHIAAAVRATGQTSLLQKEFIAFHVSGGTTDVLLVKPDGEKIFDITEIASSLDLKAGQAVDRVGVMLGLKFPAGPELDRLANKSEKEYNIKPFMRDGSCSFSGVENKCGYLLDRGEPPENIAKYCIDYIFASIKEMTAYALKKYGNLPIIYAGGVMSNLIIRKKIKDEFGGFFAPPEYSSDNAAGTAYLGFLKENL